LCCLLRNAAALTPRRRVLKTLFVTNVKFVFIDWFKFEVHQVDNRGLAAASEEGDHDISELAKDAYSRQLQGC
jgi:hypothetical protein